MASRQLLVAVWIDAASLVRVGRRGRVGREPVGIDHRALLLPPGGRPAGRRSRPGSEPEALQPGPDPYRDPGGGRRLPERGRLGRSGKSQEKRRQQADHGQATSNPLKHRDLLRSTERARAVMAWTPASVSFPWNQRALSLDLG